MEGLHDTHHNPFHVLIGCVLSQRTKDETTDAACQRLFGKAKTPVEMLQLSARDIARLIYPVGFYLTKAKRILEICQMLLEVYGGAVPETLEGLMALPGVGRKTAGIVMVYGHRRGECIPTDSHVFQIANRLGWVKERTPEKTEQALMRVVPKKYWGLVNEVFVLYGKKICTPVSPHCSTCMVQRHCKRVGVLKHR